MSQTVWFIFKSYQV